MRYLHIAATVLLIVGGLNWGLVSLFEYDLVASIVGLEFGETNAASRVIYGLVGLSALVAAVSLPALFSADRRDHAAVGSRSGM